MAAGTFTVQAHLGPSLIGNFETTRLAKSLMKRFLRPNQMQMNALTLTEEVTQNKIMEHIKRLPSMFLLKSEREMSDEDQQLLANLQAAGGYNDFKACLAAIDEQLGEAVAENVTTGKLALIFPEPSVGAQASQPASEREPVRTRLLNSSYPCLVCGDSHKLFSYSAKQEAVVFTHINFSECSKGNYTSGGEGRFQFLLTYGFLFNSKLGWAAHKTNNGEEGKMYGGFSKKTLPLLKTHGNPLHLGEFKWGRSRSGERGSQMTMQEYLETSAKVFDHNAVAATCSLVAVLHALGAPALVRPVLFHLNEPPFLTAAGKERYAAALKGSAFATLLAKQGVKKAEPSPCIPGPYGHYQEKRTEEQKMEELLRRVGGEHGPVQVGACTEEEDFARFRAKVWFLMQNETTTHPIW